MKLSAATAHIKALSSSALMPRRSVAKTGGASSVLDVIHTPCSDGAMSVDSCRSNATKSITMMDVDPLRRRRDEDMSLDTSIDGKRFRRKVCADNSSGKDGDSIGEVSMGGTVKGSISSRSGLNGPYWADFELEVARCGDVFGMKISIPYRRLTRSRLKMASRSEISCDVSSMEGTQESSSMEIGYENDEDVFIEQSFITRRIIDEDPDSDSDDSGDDDDEDEESVTSNLTADVEGDLAFEGLDVQAIDVCQKRMGRMDLDENSNVMEVDDDEDSVVIARYLIKTTEVLDQHKSRRYFTRGLAKLLLKRTRSGLCY